MGPVIHCIRHGQGLHNVGEGHYDLPDPRLTPEGEAQCIALREKHFANPANISLITTSPMTRAIQSAYLIFQPLLEKPDRPQSLLAIPDAQETSDDPCDVGSDPELLREVCEQNRWPVDLSLVGPGWNEKHHRGRYSPSSKAIFRRARDVRLYLRQKARELIAAGDEDVQIVLLAHGGFMHYFTGDWEGADARPGTGWTNCEVRSYTFAEGVDDDRDYIDEDALLVEVMSSRKQRGLHHPMLDRKQQDVLYEKTMAAWESQGLQNHAKVGMGEDGDEEDEDGGELKRQHTCRQ